MDIEKIEKLMEAMNTHQIHKLEIQDTERTIILEKYGSAPAPTFAAPIAMAPAATAVAPVAMESTPAGQYVTAPIVGTFYASPSPDASPFVKVGDRVTPDTVVCIIEAMKVMNEVKAGLSGMVAEILVKSGDPVEFGTKILRIS